MIFISADNKNPLLIINVEPYKFNLLYVKKPSFKLFLSIRGSFNNFCGMQDCFFVWPVIADMWLPGIPEQNWRKM